MKILRRGIKASRFLQIVIQYPSNIKNTLYIPVFKNIRLFTLKGRDIRLDLEQINADLELKRFKTGSIKYVCILLGSLNADITRDGSDIINKSQHNVFSRETCYFHVI